MSVTLDTFKARSGCTVFRDTHPENTNPRSPRLWVELAANEPVAGARKGDYFSDVVTGQPVSRVEAYKRYWAGTGMSPKSLEGELFGPNEQLPRQTGYVPMSDAEMATSAVVAGAALALGTLLLRAFRAGRS